MRLAEALRGEPVVVGEREWDGRDEVALPWQPSALDERDYPGWVDLPAPGGSPTSPAPLAWSSPYDDRVTTASDGSLWGRFEHDPRDPAYAGVRASDRDRAVVQDALSAAYAEGRLDRDELDERTSQVDGAKTYGALLPPLLDLAADAAVPALNLASRSSLERQAQGYYREKLTEAFMAFLIPNLIVWTIWFFSGHGFPWPVFVLLAMVGNLVRIGANKKSIIDARIEKLERRQAKALEPPKPPKPSKTTSSSKSSERSEQGTKAESETESEEA